MMTHKSGKSSQKLEGKSDSYYHTHAKPPDEAGQIIDKTSGKQKILKVKEHGDEKPHNGKQPLSANPKLSEFNIDLKQGVATCFHCLEEVEFNKGSLEANLLSHLEMDCGQIQDEIAITM